MARSGWVDYRRSRGTNASTVVGDLRVRPGLADPRGTFTRDVLVHLPERALATGRRYADTGGREGSMAPTDAEAARRSAAFRLDVLRIRDALLAAGLREPVGLGFVEERDAIHHEAAWARRLPDALRFLFGPAVE